MNQTTLTPAQRRRRSHAALARRVIDRAADGESLAAISRRKHMPHRNTLARWLDQDARFRARFEAARRAGMQAAADEVVALADAYAATAPAKKRSVAVRMQIEARKWWVRQAASELRDERREERKDDARATNKAPAADEPSIGAIIAQRLREREAQLKREAEARAAQVPETNDAPPTAPEGEPPTPSRETRAPQPIPTVVYGWPPPSPSSDAPGAPTGNGSPAPSAETPRRAPPAASAAPSRTPSRSPLVPDWFLDRPEPPQPPYDPLKW